MAPNKRHTETPKLKVIIKNETFRNQQQREQSKEAERKKKHVVSNLKKRGVIYILNSFSIRFIRLQRTTTRLLNGTSCRKGCAVQLLAYSSFTCRLCFVFIVYVGFIDNFTMWKWMTLLTNLSGIISVSRMKDNIVIILLINVYI